MTEPLNPEHLEELMTGYVLGDLNPEEALEFQRLLAENPQLATEVSSLQEALEMLPYALPEVTPPPHLRTAILEAANSSLTPTSTPKRFSLPWSKIAAGAAALLALALGLDNYNLRQQLKTVQAQNEVIEVLQQRNTRLFTLTGTENANTASGSIAINTNEQKAVIVFQNLPASPVGQIYRLWAIVDDKKIACANFDASQQGTVLAEFTIPAAACSSTKSTLAVTLEPSTLPPQPVGPAVMVESSL
ncbi:anti-sigma factor [Funiculus sociatus GB2-A5]|uniref:Regulator of SigK n=1 Tax=Funiculus sociatus GB2-A5 TaxID=2933946 RepID=A0ABV0JU80_9CYAN|nr:MULTISPECIES: anti-sigma factor [unclassified Trichocoleus]MBD1905072.1 anti-sigma factor [Trichocoleus sp. FACHB-832]MBD2062606.1 anti-sigma factor [Trichocoleus sp. FACHB-6]